MGTIGLLFKTQVRLGVDADAEVGFLDALPSAIVQLDASLEETHMVSNEVTQFPVEIGADISDHVRRQPERVTIRGIVSDHPITILGTITATGGIIGSGRSIDAYQKMLVLINEASLISVVTSLRTYRNMVVESMSVPRNPRRSSSVEMTLNLREVQTTEVAKLAGVTNLGTQNTTPVVAEAGTGFA